MGHCHPINQEIIIQILIELVIFRTYALTGKRKYGYKNFQKFSD
jgi:hypothetical protein